MYLRWTYTEAYMVASVLGNPGVALYFRILTIKKNSNQSERYLLGIYYVSQALCSTLENKDKRLFLPWKISKKINKCNLPLWGQ